MSGKERKVVFKGKTRSSPRVSAIQGWKQTKNWIACLENPTAEISSTRHRRITIETTLLTSEFRNFLSSNFSVAEYAKPFFTIFKCVLTSRIIRRTQNKQFQ